MLLLAVSDDDDVGVKRTGKWVLDIKKHGEADVWGIMNTLMPHPGKDEKRFYIYFRMTIL